MNGLTAADFADTGQWRLIVEIHRTGICAHIENTVHEELPPQLLFKAEWEADADTLLRNIENAVYDHPRVLDDYSARIIVYDMRTMFLPTVLTENSDLSVEEIYVSVFGGDVADVMVDVDADLTAAHSLAAGLRGFLNRTFPGAKMESNLMRSVRETRRGGCPGKRMCVDIRETEADFILLDGEELLSASTHAVRTEEDVAYHALNILDVYGLGAADVRMEAAGGSRVEEVKKIFAAAGAGTEQNTEL